MASIRILDTSTTLPLACLLSEASACRSISTGKERDTESGNDYFGARYYSSSMGRFMSPDWSAKEDPVPYAHLDDPQSLNLYSYVENNPLFKADLDGHGCPPDCSTGNDFVDFVNGLTNAWGSDNVLGAGRNDQSTRAGQLGQAFGDFGAAVQGGYETLLGIGGDVVGGGLDATGVGALAGVPINVASTAAVLHGTATGTEGATHLAMALKPGSKGGPGAGKKTTPAQREKILKENGGKCVVDGCNNAAEHVDHAVARSKNGDTTDANLQGMCAHHNCQKGAKSSAEYQEWLKKQGQK